MVGTIGKSSLCLGIFLLRVTFVAVTAIMFSSLTFHPSMLILPLLFPIFGLLPLDFTEIVIVIRPPAMVHLS